MTNLSITYKSPEALVSYARNARVHTKAQIRQIAGSIDAFGFNNPILIDKDDRIIAGHGRVEAAKLLGLDTVPTVRLEHLSEAQKRAYILADNKLAEKAGWDDDVLAIELQHLTESDIDFDLTLTGFETAEIDLLLGEAEEPDDDAADNAPAVDDAAPAVSKPGDLWHLGPHRILCGDATKAESYETLLGDKKAQMIFTDPPYNVPVDGHVGGLGNVKHREFAMAAGEMSAEEFTAFLQTVLGNLANYSADGSIHYVCMDWAHLYELLTAARAVYTEQKNLCVWNKTNGGMGTLYRSKHELIGVFKKGKKPHINNVELGRHGRYRTNVWDFAGISSLGADRAETLALHPTVKPVVLVAEAIKDCSKRKGIILDPFLGAGTTLMAAERTGRYGYGMELDPHYVDTALQRWQAYTGETAYHVETGLSFAEVAEQRTAASIAAGEESRP